MKIRKGFVSNSSSSSFVITGKEYIRSDFETMLFAKLTDDEKVKYEEDSYEFMESTFPEKFPGLEHVEDYEAGYIYIGETPETSKETRERIAKALSGFDPNAKSSDVSLICEELYN